MKPIKPNREQILRRIESESAERRRKAREKYELEHGLKFYDFEEFDRRIKASEPTFEQLTFL